MLIDNVQELESAAVGCGVDVPPFTCLVLMKVGGGVHADATC